MTLKNNNYLLSVTVSKDQEFRQGLDMILYLYCILHGASDGSLEN